jgi:hypothetical protein
MRYDLLFKVFFKLFSIQETLNDSFLGVFGWLDMLV